MIFIFKLDKQGIKVTLILIIALIVIGVVIYKDFTTMNDERDMLQEVIDEKNSEIERLSLEVDELIDDKVHLEVKKDYYKERVDKLEEEGEALKEKIRLQSNRSSSSRKVSLGTFEATAYTDNVKSQGKWVGQTATGRKPQVGVIAVDPKIIPLGTKLYVEGYGECVAGDTGGAIKGRIIDVFLPDENSCMKWGRKKVKVWKIN